MRIVRDYWLHSAGLAVVWGLILLLGAAVGGEARVLRLPPVFGGCVLGWVTTTIAGYAYPSPATWRQ